MSGIGIFKSSQEAAQGKAVSMIGAAGNSIGIAAGVPGRTNLKVITNMETMKQKLSECNTDFIQLVKDDSESILKLSEFFIDHDTEIATTMSEGSDN